MAGSDSESNVAGNGILVNHTYTFHVYDEVLFDVMEMGGADVQVPLLVLKDPSIALFRQSGQSEDAEYSDTMECVRAMGIWRFEPEEGALEDPAAAGLKSKWEAHREAEMKAKEQKEALWMKEKQQEQWWELDLVRERPAEGTSCIAVELALLEPQSGQEGKWWIVDFRLCTQEGLKAALFVGEYLGDLAEML